MRDALSYITELLRAHSNLTAVAAWGFSPIGNELAKRFGLVEVKAPGGRKLGNYEMSRSEALRIPRPRTPFEAERVLAC